MARHLNICIANSIEYNYKKLEFIGVLYETNNKTLIFFKWVFFIHLFTNI